MPNAVKSPDPARFGLASFSDLLPTRDHIVGEDPEAFDAFRAAMMQSLEPMTAYECVVAENLIDIEWQLVQHRRMRDVGLRQRIHADISRAVKNWQEYHFVAKRKRAFEAHLAAGGSRDDWEYPFHFDYDAAMAKGEDLAKRAVSKDKSVQEQAYVEITELGLEPVEVMGQAYRSHESSITHHDQRVNQLERRRREVKRDFDMLQRSRPYEAEVIEG